MCMLQIFIIIIIISIIIIIIDDNLIEQEVLTNTVCLSQQTLDL